MGLIDRLAEAAIYAIDWYFEHPWTVILACLIGIVVGVLADGRC